MYYLRSLLISFVACCLLFLMAAIYQVGAPTESSRWMWEIQYKKEAYANSITQRKLVAVSGSNVLFGLNTAQMSKTLGMPVVNGATSADMGLNFILDRARLMLKRGDIALLLLEYDLYIHDDNQEELIDLVMSHYPGYAISHPEMFVQLSFKRLWQGIQNKWYSPKPLVGHSTELTFSGDYVKNRLIDRTPKQHQNVLSVAEHFEPSELKGAKAIKSFVRWCKKHDIQVLATWPSIISFPDFQTPPYQKFFRHVALLYYQMGIPTVGSPQNFMYPRELFFDFLYHLTSEGREQRTRDLLRLLASDAKYHL